MMPPPPPPPPRSPRGRMLLGKLFVYTRAAAAFRTMYELGCSICACSDRLNQNRWFNLRIMNARSVLHIIFLLFCLVNYAKYVFLKTNSPYRNHRIIYAYAWGICTKLKKHFSEVQSHLEK